MAGKSPARYRYNKSIFGVKTGVYKEVREVWDTKEATMT